MLNLQLVQRTLQVIVAGSLLATASVASAITCTTNSVTINTIETSPLDSSGLIYGPPGSPVAATSCQGVYTGNDYDGNLNGTNISQMGNNIGQLNDGLLNGEGGLLSPTWFQPPLGYAQSPMLDIDGDGNATDPGWIRLGKIEYDEDTSRFDPFISDSMTVGAKTLEISDVLNVKMTCNNYGDCTTGTWSLETELDIIEKVQALLGRNAFDHLAMVIKASDSFAVYDFDFNLLSAGLTGFDYKTPYSFTGSWNTDDFLNANDKAQAISHLSIWARDPQGDNNEVPEPGSLLLLGIALAGLGLSARRRHF